MVSALGLLCVLADPSSTVARGSAGNAGSDGRQAVQIWWPRDDADLLPRRSQDGGGDAGRWAGGPERAGELTVSLGTVAGRSTPRGSQSLPWAQGSSLVWSQAGPCLPRARKWLPHPGLSFGSARSAGCYGNQPHLDLEPTVRRPGQMCQAAPFLSHRGVPTVA